MGGSARGLMCLKPWVLPPPGPYTSAPITTQHIKYVPGGSTADKQALRPNMRPTDKATTKQMKGKK